MEICLLICQAEIFEPRFAGSVPNSQATAIPPGDYSQMLGSLNAMELVLGLPGSTVFQKDRNQKNRKLQGTDILCQEHNYRRGPRSCSSEAKKQGH